MDIDDDDPDDVVYTVTFCMKTESDAEDMNEGECGAAIDLYMKLESEEISK